MDTQADQHLTEKAKDNSSMIIKADTFVIDTCRVGRIAALVFVTYGISLSGSIGPVDLDVPFAINIIIHSDVNQHHLSHKIVNLIN